MNSSLYVTRPDVVLRYEGLAILVVACFAYQHLRPGHWGLFALLFLAPDISLLAFAWSKGRGVVAFYNALHTEALPLALGLVAWMSGSTPGLGLALIWLAHISFDRLLGFGLKYPGSFQLTHMQRAASLSPP